MSGLGPSARSLIDAASGGDDPSTADAARVRAKIAARLAIAASTGVAGLAATETTAAATTAAAAGTGTKVALAVAIFGATSAGGALLYEHSIRDVAAVSAPAPIVVPASPGPRASAPLAVAPTPSTLPMVVPTTEPAPPRTESASASAVARSEGPPRTKAAPRPRATDADTVVEEARLLRSAHSSLAAGDGRGAMAVLDEHASRFPRGALAEERQASRVLALCAQGRAVEARAAAAAFIAASPRSPLAAQVRRSCATNESE